MHVGSGDKRAGSGGRSARLIDPVPTHISRLHELEQSIQHTHTHNGGLLSTVGPPHCGGTSSSTRNFHPASCSTPSICAIAAALGVFSDGQRPSGVRLQLRRRPDHRVLSGSLEQCRGVGGNAILASERVRVIGCLPLAGASRPRFDVVMDRPAIRVCTVALSCLCLCVSVIRHSMYRACSCPDVYVRTWLDQKSAGHSSPAARLRRS